MKEQETSALIASVPAAYSLTNDAIAEIAADCALIVVVDGEDEEGFERARKARLRVREKRVQVEKTRKALKRDALDYGKAVDAEAKRIKARLEPIEDRLKAQEQKVLDERERVKAAQVEAERIRVEELVARFDELDAVAPAGLASFTEFEVSAALDLARARKKFLDEKAERDAKAKAEQEAKDLKLRQEQEATREQLRKDQEALEAEKAKARQEREELAAEREKIRKERQELATGGLPEVSICFQDEPVELPSRRMSEEEMSQRVVLERAHMKQPVALTPLREESFVQAPADPGASLAPGLASFEEEPECTLAPVVRALLPSDRVRGCADKLLALSENEIAFRVQAELREIADDLVTEGQ